MRPLLLAPLLLALPGLAAADVDHNSTCGGWAPEVNDCTTGTHTTPIYGVNTITFGDCSALYTCFVGDLQIVLRPAEGGAGPTFLRTCSVVTAIHLQLFLLDCSDAGSFPAPPYVHECHVRAYRSMDRTVAGSGLPGAVGPWTCRVVHDPIGE
ncbi:MAG TPA: hypothetical protein VGR28_06835 [Candidatus Thermoplasmatota archaeon]|jgi:hypothetical protein|nr:hypothetical protein [Candidatus Thermoplasmatota archaeon]